MSEMRSVTRIIKIMSSKWNCRLTICTLFCVYFLFIFVTIPRLNSSSDFTKNLEFDHKYSGNKNNLLYQSNPKEFTLMHPLKVPTPTIKSTSSPGPYHSSTTVNITLPSSKLPIPQEEWSISNVKKRWEKVQQSIPFHEAELEMKKRRDRVTIFCQKYHMGNYHRPGSLKNDLFFSEKKTTSFQDWFWIRERLLGWCPVYKAGSTSMFHHFLLLNGGYSEEELIHLKKDHKEMFMNISGRGQIPKSIIAKSKKIIVVRHPFERLFAAYKAKLSNSTIGQDDGTPFYYKKYGSKIVKKYRVDPKILQIEPTWEEFVRYILKSNFKLFDEHWLPVFQTCYPCLVDYDIIATVETFSTDQTYFISKLGLGDVLKKPIWRHRSSDLNEDTRKNVAREYYSQLTKQQIKDLCSKYLMDFVLFGYSPDEYIAYGKD